MNYPDITNAILAIKSDAEVSVSGDNINKINWIDDNPTNITNEAILAKQVELQAVYDNLEYSRDRANEYPPIGDQLDMLWHSIDEDASLKSKYFAFHQAILAIKSKYSK